jgi:hypothetical protein
MVWDKIGTGLGARFMVSARVLLVVGVVATLGACSKPAKTTAETRASPPVAVAAPEPAPAPPVAQAAPAVPVESESARRVRVEREEFEAERVAFAEARARVAEIERNSARAQAASDNAAAEQAATQRERDLATEAQVLAEENAYLQGQADEARRAASQPHQVLATPFWASGRRGKPPRIPRDEGRTPIVGSPPGALHPFTALPGGSFSPAIRGEKRDTEQR